MGPPVVRYIVGYIAGWSPQHLAEITHQLCAPFQQNRITFGKSNNNALWRRLRESFIHFRGAAIKVNEPREHRGAFAATIFIANIILKNSTIQTTIIQEKNPLPQQTIAGHEKRERNSLFILAHHEGRLFCMCGAWFEKKAIEHIKTTPGTTLGLFRLTKSYINYYWPYTRLIGALCTLGWWWNHPRRRSVANESEIMVADLPGK